MALPFDSMRDAALEPGQMVSRQLRLCSFGMRILQSLLQVGIAWIRIARRAPPATSDEETWLACICYAQLRPGLQLG